nr:hypothetical protein [Ktedonobacteraceae bacterium]
ESADMVLLVFDGSQDLAEQDRRVSQELRAMGFGRKGNTQADDHETYGSGRPVIIVMNKSDCAQRLRSDEVRSMWPGAPLVTTSTRTGAGLSELEEAIAQLALGDSTLTGESVLITNARHQEALRRAAEHLEASLTTLAGGLPLDFISIDLHAAYTILGEITGETASEGLLERIFSEFCIGK